jgi:16S rRNA (uracil1498-N3)-methyltransferase
LHRFFLPVSFAESMTIMGKDAHHISHVLRMKVGQQLQIVSNDQVSALMEIEAITEAVVSVRLVEKLATFNEPSVRIILAQGLPKSDKMDFIVQKAVEMGVSEIIPVSMDNCVVQLDTEKARKKSERWQKIVEEAAKQSKREIVPQVSMPLTLKQLLDLKQGVELKIVAYEVEDKRGLKELLQSHKSIKEILLLIGPEGGISKEEFELLKEGGMTSVSLGRRILRTETAGIATVAAILYETGDFGG